MRSGFAIINKPVGMTSYDVIRQLKKVTGIKKLGHTGTLDPNTDGVLVIAFNRATKFIPEITKNSLKKYRATMLFGIQTDTDDITGEVVKRKAVPEITNQQIDDLFMAFPKQYHQMPPAYSAKKINGKRAYALARKGQNVELTPKLVEIKSINRISDVKDNQVSFEVEVSKGTYVRSLIVDLAKELQTIATMSALKRLETDGFNINMATELSEFTQEMIYPLESYIKTNYPVINVDDEKAKQISNGVVLDRDEKLNYPVVFEYQKQLLAIYEAKDEAKIKLKIMLKDLI